MVVMLSSSHSAARKRRDKREHGKARDNAPAQFVIYEQGALKYELNYIGLVSRSQSPRKRGAHVRRIIECLNWCFSWKHSLGQCSEDAFQTSFAVDIYRLLISDLNAFDYRLESFSFFNHHQAFHCVLDTFDTLCLLLLQFFIIILSHASQGIASFTDDAFASTIYYMAWSSTRVGILLPLSDSRVAIVMRLSDIAIKANIYKQNKRVSRLTRAFRALRRRNDCSCQQILRFNCKLSRECWRSEVRN